MIGETGQREPIDPAGNALRAQAFIEQPAVDPATNRRALPPRKAFRSSSVVVATADAAPLLGANSAPSAFALAKGRSL